MSLLKTISHHGSSSGRLERYLLDGADEWGKSRCLAIDAASTVRNPKKFAQEFDEVREFWGKNSGITMRHFIISPDPEAHATLDQVRALACTWAGRHFGDDGQWVVAYHNDNGIVHAHVALNWVRLDGIKWQFVRGEYADVANDLHDLAREMGLACNLRDVGRKQRENVTRWNKNTGAERRIARRRGWSWKEDIRHAVRQCAPKSRSIAEMRDNLDRFYGIKVIERKRGGLTFIHPMHRGTDNHRFMVKDYKLGAGFTGEGIEGMLAYDISELLEGGDVPTEGFSLRIDRASRELGFGRSRATIRKPRGYTDRLIRKSRRIGLTEVKGMADALRCMRRASEEAGNPEGGMQRVWETLTQRRDALARQCAEREVVRKAAMETLMTVQSYNDTLPVQLELEGKGILARGRFRRENAEVLDEHARASEWLGAHGIETVGKSISADEVAAKAKALNMEVGGLEERLRSENALISDLDRSISLMQRHLAPVRLRGSAHAPASAGERDIPLAAPIRRRTEPPVGHRVRYRSDAPICARRADAAPSASSAVDPARQGVAALCGGVDDAQASRRAQGVQRAQAIDIRIVREDAERARKVAVGGNEAPRTQQPVNPQRIQGDSSKRRTVAEVARQARARAEAARQGQLRGHQQQRGR